MSKPKQKRRVKNGCSRMVRAVPYICGKDGLLCSQCVAETLPLEDEMIRRSRMWWFNEGKMRERASIVRLLKKLEKLEVKSAHRGLLNSVADIVEGRKPWRMR